MKISRSLVSLPHWLGTIATTISFVDDASLHNTMGIKSEHRWMEKRHRGRSYKRLQIGRFIWFWYSGVKTLALGVWWWGGGGGGGALAFVLIEDEYGTTNLHSQHQHCWRLNITWRHEDTEMHCSCILIDAELMWTMQHSVNHHHVYGLCWSNSQGADGIFLEYCFLSAGRFSFKEWIPWFYYGQFDEL